MNAEDRPVSGRITRIAGPVIEADHLEHVSLYDVILVGDAKLIGEVIRLEGQLSTIQVYEDTSGIRIGEPVQSTGSPLVAQLGPGLLGTIYDGLQRPLSYLLQTSGAFIKRGAQAPALPHERSWRFQPRVAPGDSVSPGDVLGTLPETESIEHHIMVPAGLSGRIVEIREGEVTTQDVVAVVATTNNAAKPSYEITLTQSWPVRKPRPAHVRLDPNAPLTSGFRIVDTFFPVARGGTAIIPGGFGTGKTVIEQSLARWANVDVVVYVGCGERGNEMTEVLEEFPKLEDPRTGTPLMGRTVLLANTSNMPVAAREASIYLGITIAEYYRDMGYDVLLLADSTSRWGEALREISGRLEEIPEEEGYPAYIGARLSGFYERAGWVRCLGTPGRNGSVTIIGAVSPPGADFSEPLTQASMRVADTFWALDYDLSRRRHFPAINWTTSYSLSNLREWYERECSSDWQRLVSEARALLQREAELLQIVQLVGSDALSKNERLVLFSARMLREDFLQQSSYNLNDGYCTLPKTVSMLRIVVEFNELASAALDAGAGLEHITTMSIVQDVARMREIPASDVSEKVTSLLADLHSQFDELSKHG